MKNKLLKISLVFAAMITIVVLSNKYFVQTVQADSGWDSSYDSGGSSDWSSSSSSSGTSGSSEQTTISDSEALIAVGIVFGFLFIFLGIPILIMDHYGIMTIMPSSDKKLYVSRRIKFTQEQANKVIPNFDIEGFNKKAYQIFYDVQMAWMNFEYDKLKELLTDELYNTYLMDLEALKVKGQRNTMKDFELLETKLIELKEEKNTYVAKVYLNVKFYDYIENSTTGKVLRGTLNKKLNNTYILTFVKTKEDKKVSYCPRCGAEVKGNTTGVCEYCKSKLINETHDWVMSKKEKISQR